MFLPHAIPQIEVCTRARILKTQTTNLLAKDENISLRRECHILFAVRDLNFQL